MEGITVNQLVNFEQLTRLQSSFKKSAKICRSVSYLENLLEKILQIHQDFQQGDRDIRSLLNNADDLKSSYFKEDLRGKFEDIYLDFASEVKELLRATGAFEAQPVVTTVARDSEVKLPRINLPIFGGKYGDWISFRDLFVSLIHNRKTMTDVEKLHYLKCNVVGEPASLIKHFAITEENYATAWKLLNERYDNTHILLTSQFKELFKIGSATETSSSLKMLLDRTTECVQSIENFKLVNLWDSILVFITTERLPSETRQLWEQQQQGKKDNAASFENLKEFLCFRFRALEAAGVERPKYQKPTYVPSRNVYAVNSDQNLWCVICKTTHQLHKCDEFSKLEHAEKLDIVRRYGLCLNCLRKGHLCSNCPSKSRCLKCQRSHHSLLHRDNTQHSLDTAQTNFSSARNVPHDMPTYSKPSVDEIHAPEMPPEVKEVYSTKSNKTRDVLLATALVRLESISGLITLRALLDQGSQTSLISESAVQRLSLKREKTDITISGIGRSSLQSVKGLTNATLRTKDNTMICFEALILTNLTNMIPSRSVSHSAMSRWKKEELADPLFDQPGKIDLILGADVYARIILGDIYRMPEGPIAQNSKLGWVISGEVYPSKNYQSFKIEMNEDLLLANQLKQFWEIEEVASTKQYSEEEQNCEKHFMETVRRSEEGRFIVRLPFKNEIMKQSLGSSRASALGSLLSLEKRMISKPDIHKQYSTCMNEYLEMGHMKLAPNNLDHETVQGKTICTATYLPHHAVYRESSTTNCRIVFDASRKTSTGTSLNEILMTGPSIQTDMLAVLIRWRLYQYAFAADIAKMYKQIEMDINDANYQRILWRSNPTDEIRDYCLTTVTFGTTCAPYLAIKCLHTVAEEVRNSHPKVYESIMNEFYVDDVLSGDHEISDAIEKRNNLIEILGSAGFPLRKWISNHPSILETLAAEDVEMDSTNALNIDTGYKSLGLLWYPQSDQFGYKVRLSAFEEKVRITKRQVLSEIAKLYDPMGWLAPVMIIAKILLQSLWLHGFNWDDLLSEELQEIWINFHKNLHQLEDLRVPRWIKFTTKAEISIHGFCDASLKAYAANVYIIIRTDNEVHSHLLMAKTKVAPIRTISVPRLELCGAVLLAKLIRKINGMLKQEINTLLWTDSEIVIAWLRDHPTRWTTFVANRTTEILEIVGNSPWKHVPSTQNPADLASRGVSIHQLKENELWWSGPTWLKQHPDIWPQKKITPVNIERKKRLVHASINETNNLDELHNKFSSVARLIRVTVYCIRFINFIRKRSSVRNELEVNEIRSACVFLVKYIELNQNYRMHRMNIDTKEKLVHATIRATNSLEELESKFSSLTRLVRVTAYCFRFGELTRKLTKECKHLTAQEHRRAFEFWIRHIQHKQFSTELKNLASKNPLEKSSKLGNLNPFIDGNGFLRVGGRLANSSLPYDERHPIILPKNEVIINLLLQQLHKETLHGQTQVMLNAIRRRFWLLDGRNAIKKVVHNCVKCFRAAAKGSTQLMGSLPSPRTTFCRPFTHTGVDYCGPFEVKDRKGRGSKITKGYVAIFICLSVKAIHIEVVSDLTTHAFLAALHRFMARRGLSSHMYCDCGTNFVGARSELDRVMRIASEKAAEELAARGISWHFNPPASPHFGELWEAGVKAIKTHFRRVIGNVALTYEELSTVMVRIEACLNSRPLCPLNDDPNDVRALTPAHFLIGDTMLAPPEQDFTETRLNLLDRWQRTQQLVQHFWIKWKTEYLSRLQTRPKWTEKQRCPKVGDICVVKDERSLPYQWPLAKIISTHSGKDGLIRVVTVKLNGKILKRPIVKIACLPDQDALTIDN